MRVLIVDLARTLVLLDVEAAAEAALAFVSCTALHCAALRLCVCDVLCHLSWVENFASRILNLASWQGALAYVRLGGDDGRG